MGTGIRSKAYLRYLPLLAQSIQEICRVLRPNGTVEVVEDGEFFLKKNYPLESDLTFIDIIFPTLPLWFTNALRVRPLRHRTCPRASELPSPDGATSYNIPLHDHALLESLHTAIYSNRFINMKPLCMFFSWYRHYWAMVESIFCSHFAELFDNIL